MSTTEVLEPKPLLIGGEWMDDTPSYITSINPATGEVNYRVCAATEANIDAAVKSARRAYSDRSLRLLRGKNARNISTTVSWL